MRDPQAIIVRYRSVLLNVTYAAITVVHHFEHSMNVPMPNGLRCHPPRLLDSVRDVVCIAANQLHWKPCSQSAIKITHKHSYAFDSSFVFSFHTETFRSSHTTEIKKKKSFSYAALTRCYFAFLSLDFFLGVNLLVVFLFLVNFFFFSFIFRSDNFIISSWIRVHVRTTYVRFVLLAEIMRRGP